MTGVPVGQRAVGLAWLPPAADALLALAAEPPDAAALLRDPAAVAHVFRYARPTPDPTGPVFTADVLTQSGLCEAAASLLDTFPVNSRGGPVPAPVATVTTLAAAVAAELAEHDGTVSPDAAAGVARLASLGWYAVAAVDAARAAECFENPAHATNPELVQRRMWGLNAAAIARRLVGRWRLPRAVAAVIGGLRLAPEDGVRLGAPDSLFRIVQAAVHASESAIARLGLTDPRFVPRFSHTDPRAIAERLLPTAEASTAPTVVRDPDLMVRLLRATARGRRSSGAVWLAEAEGTTDRLMAALSDWRAEFDDRLRAAKLESLAEFAAGASHEINNPLAVISGHAQLLLARETDPDRHRQLTAIVRQTKRVHDLLQGTLHFARPPRPERTRVAVAAVVADVVAAFRPDAEAKALTVDAAIDPIVFTLADSSQLRQTLGHLVRNAIDAAPEGGWVRVCADADDGVVRIAVEDSGPGPAAKHVPHLFDPFFSGRSAGRGRGLGLSIAWRLARVNDGDLRYVPSPDGTTRFVLTLPTVGGASLPSDGRKIA